VIRCHAGSELSGATGCVSRHKKRATISAKMTMPIDMCHVIGAPGGPPWTSGINQPIAEI
jgi:hypothetical protein